MAKHIAPETAKIVGSPQDTGDLSRDGLDKAAQEFVTGTRSSGRSSDGGEQIDVGQENVNRSPAPDERDTSQEIGPQVQDATDYFNKWMPKGRSIDDEPRRLTLDDLKRQTSDQRTDDEPPDTGDTDDPDSVSLDDVEIDADGNLRIQIGESIYMGKGESMNEKMNNLLRNMSKGISDKDAFIASGDFVRPPKVKGGQLVDDSALEEPARLPPRHELLKQIAERNGIDPAMLSWDDDKWEEYEQEHGRRKTARLEQAVNAAREEAERQYNQLSVSVVNEDIINDETEHVRARIAEAGINLEKDGFNYEKVLQTVWNEPKNFKNGVLRSGTIVSAAEREISRITTRKVREETRQQIDNEYQANRQTREKAKGISVTTREPFKGNRRAAPQDNEEAFDQLMSEIGGGRR
jgi:hypothetical protein